MTPPPPLVKTQLQKKNTHTHPTLTHMATIPPILTMNGWTGSTQQTTHIPSREVEVGEMVYTKYLMDIALHCVIFSLTLNTNSSPIFYFFAQSSILVIEKE